MLNISQKLEIIKKLINDWEFNLNDMKFIFNINNIEYNETWIEFYFDSIKNPFGDWIEEIKKNKLIDGNLIFSEEENNPKSLCKTINLDSSVNNKFLFNNNYNKKNNIKDFTLEYFNDLSSLKVENENELELNASQKIENNMENLNGLKSNENNVENLNDPKSNENNVENLNDLKNNENNVENLNDLKSNENKNDKSKLNKIKKKKIQKKKKRGNYVIYDKKKKSEALELCKNVDPKTVSELLNISFKNLKNWLKLGVDKKITDRKIFNPEMEDNLCKYIEFYYKHFKKIPNENLIKQKAISLSNSKKFKASQFWYDKFMTRCSKKLPKLKIIINKTKNNNINKKEISKNVKKYLNVINNISENKENILK